jgi:hypothetical protein
MSWLVAMFLMTLMLVSGIFKNKGGEGLGGFAWTSGYLMLCFVPVAVLAEGVFLIFNWRKDNFSQFLAWLMTLVVSTWVCIPLYWWLLTQGMVVVNSVTGRQ